MSENMGADVAFDAGFFGYLGESGIGVLAGQRATSSSEEKEALWTLFKSGTSFVDPLFDPGNGGGWERKPSRFAPLAGDSDGGSVELELVDSESDGFADAKASSINQLHEGSVAESDRLSQVWDIEDRFHRLATERLGQSFGLADVEPRWEAKMLEPTLLFDELNEPAEAAKAA